MAQRVSSESLVKGKKTRIYPVLVKKYFFKTGIRALMTITSDDQLKHAFRKQAGRSDAVVTTPGKIQE
jgi:hypothetical protein